MKFSWFEKFVIGRIAREGEKRMVNFLSKNTTTTILGICAIVIAVANAITAILDGNPATVFHWQMTWQIVQDNWQLVTIGVIGVLAREQSQHEKEQEGKK